MEEIYHIPALLHPSVDLLNIQPDDICVDVTFGGGGHSKYILSQLGPDGELFGFDQDLDAIKNKPNDDRFTFVRSNFCYLKNFMLYHDLDETDAIIADLGVSSHHFNDAARGFSFRYTEEKLDMRMNQMAKLSAATILAQYSEEKIANLFYYYGELKQSRKLASAIVRERELKPIETVGDLLDIIRPYLGGAKKEKQALAQAFQALRIEVNGEMETLKDMLTQALDLLAPGGRISVISYHSLEDRIVKNFFKTGNFEGKLEKDFYGNILTPFQLVNNKVIVPTEEEINQNPRARSAKLRVAEKKDIKA